LRVDPTPFVKRYLQEAPLFASIVRGVECALAQEAGEFPEPVLDLGCGDGVFAAVAFPKGLDYGVDPSEGALREGLRHRAHRMLTVGSATEMPFPNGHFGSIVCNSVIEHIPDVESTLRECHRVLAPGGRLWITTPSHYFGGMLLGSRALRSVGLRGTAEAYARWFNGHSLHFHTDSRETWHERLEQHGFAVQQSFYYLTPGAHSAFDLLHYLSAWRWIRRRVTGRWVGSGLTLNAFWTARISGLIERSWPTEAGPYLYLDATRKS
jgi:SAM-dependent methyltransferase